jgi:hypothetical protein
MQFIFAIVSLFLLIPVAAASAQNNERTYSLSVSVHSSLPTLSEDDVKKILRSASSMLQTKPAPEDDVACGVTFTLKGPIRTFASPVTPIVDRDNIAAVHAIDSDVDGADFHVKVVKEIDFCRPELTGKFQGCSFSPPTFRSIIVVHPRLHRNAHNDLIATFPDHLLWAHEFGHLTGLGHRDDDPDALMTRCALDSQFSGASDRRVRVNADECTQHFLKGPGVPPPDVLPGAPSCRPLR